MGYIEYCCHLCAVSFHTGRIRTKGEDRSAAWANEELPEPSKATWIDQDQYSDSKPCSTAETGCYFVRRGSVSSEVPPVCDDETMGNYLHSSNDDLFEEDDNEEDLDYCPPDTATDGGSGILQNAQSSAEIDEDANLWKNFVNSCRKGQSPPAEPFKELYEAFDALPESPSAELPSEYADGLERCEHIAGPECQETRGYAGSRITTEECRGCRTMQCLFRKPTNWEQAEDDMDFELSSDYFLSGLTDTAVILEMGGAEAMPMRHRMIYVGDPCDNLPAGTDDDGILFHPTCFDVYRRVSLQRLGQVDVNGLFEWRHSRSMRQDIFDSIPHDPAVVESSEQWWQHIPGFEFLVANPIFIPGLDALITDSQTTKRATSGILTGAMDAMRNPLLALPVEILLGIAELLETADLLSLSRADPRIVTHVPTTFFRQRLHDDYPSLWECHSHPTAQHAHVLSDEENKPYLWATMTAKDVLHYQNAPVEPYKFWCEAQRAYHDEIVKYRRIIREEDPALLHEWMAAEPSFASLHFGYEWPPPIKASLRIADDEMDWPHLLLSLNARMQRNELKGLRNRQRIWKALNWLVDRIADVRSEGLISPLGTRKVHTPSFPEGPRPALDGNWDKRVDGDPFGDFELQDADLLAAKERDAYELDNEGIVLEDDEDDSTDEDEDNDIAMAD